MNEVTRRAILIAGSLLPAACVPDGLDMSTKTSPEKALEDLLELNGQRSLPAAGFVVMKDVEVIASGSAGDASGLDPNETAPSRPFTIETPMRVASISKMAVALTTLKVLDANKLTLDAPIALRNPKHPDVPVTFRHLLSHTSTIQDPPEYWVAAPNSIAPLLNDTLFSTDQPDRQIPGKWFHYANINYGIVATELERIAGERFDRLVARYVTEPLGLDAGINWSGVSNETRVNGATLYRLTDGVWTIQTDGPDSLTSTEPTILAEDGYDLKSYPPGQNGTLFSPQGGLRASLVDIAKLVGHVGRISALTDEVWRLNETETNGIHDKRFFQSFGTGMFRHDADVSSWPGETLVGHHGEAYGLYAGAWRLPDLGIEVAYATTGTPEGRQPVGTVHPAFNIWSQSLMDLARNSL